MDQVNQVEKVVLNAQICAVFFHRAPLIRKCDIICDIDGKLKDEDRYRARTCKQGISCLVGFYASKTCASYAVDASGIGLQIRMWQCQVSDEACNVGHGIRKTKGAGARL